MAPSRWHALALALLMGGEARAAAPPLPEGPEVTVCGAIRERFAFWSWSNAAGSADPARAAAVPQAEPVAHVTRDGRQLGGYRLPSAAADGVTRRTVLVVGGNAMLADQILGELAPLAEAGLELFVFDYRGYGESEGRSRLLAIIGDKIELAQRLAVEGQGPLAFWGISMGGIVLANVLPFLGQDERPERFVIDGSPARISPFGCPVELDPVDRLSADTTGMLFVGGELDTVVRLDTSRELIAAIEAGGGAALVRPDFAHPFMDRDRALHQERLGLVRDFLRD
jgi:pimeloyl-ACP methyl ester carboxylesterase